VRASRAFPKQSPFESVFSDMGNSITCAAAGLAAAQLKGVCNEFAKRILEDAGIGAAALTTLGTVGLTQERRCCIKNRSPLARFHYHYLPIGPVSGRPKRRLRLAPAHCGYTRRGFKIIKDLGFDMVRIGCSTGTGWISPTGPKRRTTSKDLLKIKESGLTRIDDAIERARKYGCTLSWICIGAGYNFYETGMDGKTNRLSCGRIRWPRCVFVLLGHVAKRYRGISSKELSFDLLNEL